jgi:zinc protease
MSKFFRLVVLVLIFTGCRSVPLPNLLPASGFQLRHFKETTLSNGMKVLLVDDRALPYITYSMMFKVGAAHDPETMPGLSNFVAEMINKGTQKLNAIQIADKFGAIGASYDSDTDYDFTQLNASGLSQYSDELLDIYSSIITEANFSKEEIKRLKLQVLDAIKKSTEEPGSFSSLAYQDYLYLAHPYSRAVMGKRKGISSIEQKHVVRHFRQYYRPNNAILAVVGNYSDDIVDKLEKHFGNWKSKEVPALQFPTLPQIQGHQIRIVDKGDLVQSEIRIGHYGIRRDNPDFQKLRLANTILGGGFASRLMQEVRVRSGLTYGISSGFDARKDSGPFTISTFTRNDKVGETVKKTLQELERFRAQGATDEEVKDAKAFMIGNFPRAIETAEKLANNLMVLRLYNVSDDYLEDFVENVQKISTTEVNAVIKNYLRPENLKILVYANSGSVKEQLKPVGPIEVKSFRDYL